MSKQQRTARLRSLSSRALSIGAVAMLSMTALGTSTVDAAPNWTTVVNDTFNSGSTYPSHWHAYNGRYGSGASHNCAKPSHNTVSGGYLHMKLSWDSVGSGGCGPGWFAGGLSLDRALSAKNQRMTVRFRIVSSGGVQGHRIIPMLSPNDGTGIGEQDFCESTPFTFCSTFLHHGDEVGRDRMKYFLNLQQWHTFVFTRYGYRVTSSIDGVAKLDFSGNEMSLPSKLKHVVLQQECNKLGCPSGRTGVEDIQIDYIKVENA
jgi:hypothetical protein